MADKGIPSGESIKSNVIVRRIRSSEMKEAVPPPPKVDEDQAGLIKSLRADKALLISTVRKLEARNKTLEKDLAHANQTVSNLQGGRFRRGNPVSREGKKKPAESKTKKAMSPEAMQDMISRLYQSPGRTRAPSPQKHRKEQSLSVAATNALVSRLTTKRTGHTVLSNETKRRQMSPARAVAIAERLHSTGVRYKNAIAEKRKQKKRKEVEECSFAPEINKASRDMNQNQGVFVRLSKNDSRRQISSLQPEDMKHCTFQPNISKSSPKSTSTKRATFERLYKEAEVIHARRKEALEAVDQARRQIPEACTFSPKINGVSASTQVVGSVHKRLQEDAERRRLQFESQKKY